MILHILPQRLEIRPIFPIPENNAGKHLPEKIAKPASLISFDRNIAKKRTFWGEENRCRFCGNKSGNSRRFQGHPGCDQHFRQIQKLVFLHRCFQDVMEGTAARYIIIHTAELLPNLYPAWSQPRRILRYRKFLKIQHYSRF